MSGFSMLPHLVLAGLLAALSSGCAYPRRSTSLSPVRDVANVTGPTNVWRIQFASATIPPRQRSGSVWDEDESPPDALVRLYRNDELLFESESVENSLTPSFTNALTDNLELPANAELRIELWDADGVASQPIGIWRNRGLPRTALPGANASVTLDGLANVTFVLTKPATHRGTGVPSFEVRPSELRVLEVLTYSPAGRAGLVAGDSVVAINGQSISDVDNAKAASLFSMAGSRRATLTVVRTSGAREELQLDDGYTWHAR